ncbi:unnamed protein product [Polarella glacialis]|uniref:Uncharacterized protein n=1 Tax=Polarella glacialis TaxID=89957 RepID=A0A813FQR9_POLGL|nr:unnamed protein product [Polarella glacialis]
MLNPPHESFEETLLKDFRAELARGTFAEMMESNGFVTFKSHNFTPKGEDFVAGHPFPPCAPSDVRQSRRLARMMDDASLQPKEAKRNVFSRRSYL